MRRAFGIAVVAAAALAPACSSSSDTASTFNQVPSTSSSGGGASASSSSGAGTSSGLAVVTSAVVSEGVGLAQRETAIALGDPGEVGVVFIGGTAPHTIGFARSKDQGATWVAPIPIPAPGGREGVDPAIAYDAKGDAWISMLGLRYDASGSPTDRHAYVTHVHADGALELPLEVSNPAKADAYDKPWITRVAPSRLLVTTTSETGSRVDVAFTDDGAAWTLTSIQPDGSPRQLASPCASPDGARVFVVDVTPSAVELLASPDRGATFGAPIVVSGPGEAIAFDPPACATDGAHVFVVYGVLGTPGGESANDVSTRAVLARSDDQGKTIAARRDAFAGTDLLHPTLALGGGTLAAFAYARTSGSAGDARVRWGTGIDALGAPATLDGSIVFTPSRTDLGWLGDYASLAIAGRDLFAAFADNEPMPNETRSVIRVVHAKLSP